MKKLLLLSATLLLFNSHLFAPSGTKARNPHSVSRSRTVQAKTVWDTTSRKTNQAAYERDMKDLKIGAACCGAIVGFAFVLQGCLKCYTNPSEKQETNLPSLFVGTVLIAASTKTLYKNL